ncbi:helix-turn-helix domain-containing protein [Streptomyces sp. NPDC050560]|uniref:helix-turn-helix domain-containing protein n=1 Tax=Streptomyces sp. NPDC050560 TaxID=3365630 RepID=UPI0037A831CD
MSASLRRELGAHLRAAREQVRPQDVGLRGGGRRRAVGLRREEVAALAGVSVAWYTWLEQGRVRTSREVVDAVCGALRMGPDSRRHALALAGFLPASPLAGPGTTRPPDALCALLPTLGDTPALVLDERLDILAANAAYTPLWGDPQALPAARRNLLLQAASGTAPYRVTEPEPLVRALHEHFRSAVGHAPDDPRAAEIVALLHTLRPDAAHWWRCRAVAEFRTMTVPLTGPGGAAAAVALTLLRPVGERGLVVLLARWADAAR